MDDSAADSTSSTTTPTDTSRAALESRITAKLDEFAKQLTAAQDTGVEIDQTDVNSERAQYVCSICDEALIKQHVFPFVDSTTNKSTQITVRFALLRYALSVRHFDLYNEQISLLEPLIEKQGDWEERNHFVIYKGIFYLAQRNFEKAHEAFFSSIQTYATTSLLPFNDAMVLTTLLSVICCSRSELKAKILNSPEITQALISFPEIESFANSLAKCYYDAFYAKLPFIHTFLQTSPLVAGVATSLPSLYLRSARVVAYRQYLSTFECVGIDSMAKIFGIGEEFLEKDLARLISNGQLPCQIDLVRNLIRMQSQKSNSNNNIVQFHKILSAGDELSSQLNTLTQHAKAL